MSLADDIKHDGRVDFEDNDKSYTIMSVVPVPKLKQALKKLLEKMEWCVTDKLGMITKDNLKEIFGEELLK